MRFSQLCDKIIANKLLRKNEKEINIIIDFIKKNFRFFFRLYFSKYEEYFFSLQNKTLANIFCKKNELFTKMSTNPFKIKKSSKKSL